MKLLVLSILCIGIIHTTAWSQSSISGRVYNDVNGNRIFDTGEELNNIKVWLFDLKLVAPFYRVRPIAETFTNSSGAYNFSALLAGTYQVRVGTSTLPTSISNAVQDNDSYANGLTLVSGVNGTSAYPNINFGFAANQTTPTFTSLRSFKWNGLNKFPGGELTKSFSLPEEIVSSRTIYPIITWTTSKTCSPGVGFGNDQFPSANSGSVFSYEWPGNAKGGISTTDSTFQIMNGGVKCYNVGDSDRQVTTIGFSHPVKNVKFSVYDIDHSNPQLNAGNIDHIRITGYHLGIPVMPIIVNHSTTPWNTIS